MILKNSLNFIIEFLNYSTEQIRKVYLSSKIYNKRISKIDDKFIEYKPSPNLLDCLIKYEKKKNNIENFYLNSVWTNQNIKENDYKKLHSLFRLFTIELLNQLF